MRFKYLLNNATNQMIKNETVLVLGAGASMPYGYPSGHSLRQMLIDPSLFDPALEKKWFEREDIEMFCRTFMLSGMKSIDAFLARRGKDTLGRGHKTIEEVGKYGIAIALRQNKALDTLFQNPAWVDKSFGTDRSDNWYEYLWAQLSAGITKSNLEDFAATRLTVVTFNYDLSLEHYLFTAVQNSYGLSDDEAARLLKPIKFIHLYGQLSGNPLSASFNYVHKFDTDWRLILEDVKLIQVIDEEREFASSNFPSAVDAIQKASRICFLGFGFDETNVRRLELARIFSSRALTNEMENAEQIPFPKIVATSLGLENAERAAKRQLLTQEIKQNFKFGITRDFFEEQIWNSFENHVGFKSELTLRQSQILA